MYSTRVALLGPWLWLLAFTLSACGGGAEVSGGTVDGGGASSGSGGSVSPGSGGGLLDVGTGGGSGGGTTDRGDYVCGNGELEPGEICDDGNTKNNDGCSADCQIQDADYDCSKPGEPCTLVVICGNERIEGSEACDDGNTKDGDGCSADCRTVEDGWACPRPGVPCVALPVCGNGIRERGEECDDHNTDDDDGCSSECLVEDGFWCRTPGELCIELVCGDGNRTPDEECDIPDSDGCVNCQVAQGWRCSSNGCRPICGDGIIAGTEECDDGQQPPVSGDGCSSACKVEPFWTCSGPAGGPSTCTHTCGNGTVEAWEACDTPGQNLCSADCRRILPDPTQNNAVCGNGIIEQGEQCDGGAGCDANCNLIDGWTCPSGNLCFLTPRCGDGVVHAALGEQCDTGDDEPSPGCIDCVVQDDWLCFGSPSTCVQEICGDGVRTLNEQCDDGNFAAEDGCSPDCRLELGWVCPVEGPVEDGGFCMPRCGDSIVTGKEECDDGNRNNGDGCNSACRVEPGYVCPEEGELCKESACGNDILEPGEGCDDGNDIAGDTCSPTCQKEPTITPGRDPIVEVYCGDGLITGTEECDDGNTDDGDGCSSDCQVEDGFECSTLLERPEEVRMRVTFRDFKSGNALTPGGHPDFQYGHLSHVPGIAGVPCLTTNVPNDCGRLDSDGKPVLHIVDQAETGIRDAETFGLWFRDENIYNTVGPNGLIDIHPIVGTLTLDRIGGPDSDTYQFNADGGFFPIGPDEGFGPIGSEVSLCEHGEQGGVTCTTDCNWRDEGPDNCDLDCGTDDCRGRNYGFTSELRYFFQYQGGETLTFRGDDDVWVFVNGHLAVDIGGLHTPLYGRVVLGDDGSPDGEDSDCSAHSVEPDEEDGSFPADLPTIEECYTTAERNDEFDDRFNLVKGEVYEIVLFHAERHTQGSNFLLTLQGFLAPRSYCVSTCGDDIHVPGYEECDEGPNNKDGVSGSCTTECTLAFCGDGIPQQGEACDNGSNIDLYLEDPDNDLACAPGCVLPPRCGDASVQPGREQCDLGPNNSNASYGPDSCTLACTLGGYCGDNIHQADHEQCDLGPENGGYGPGSCNYDCTEGPYCGDGLLDPRFEECDPNIPGGDPFCDANCKLMPACGDGIPQQGEACDWGQSSTDAYGGCTDQCTWGPHCGDNTIQSDFEECDDGEDNDDIEYGACTTACVRGPHCGDGVPQHNEGEACDNGFNDDDYEYSDTACGPNCTRPPYCGDGEVDEAYELCDYGEDNDDSAYEGCTTKCEWGPYCGDGTVDKPEEECDDGLNNVLYSANGAGCGYDCKPAPYCGDGERNGPEQCDLGADNNNGEYGGCNEDCTLAAFCGDRIVQAGEECDDGPVGSLQCSANCKSRIVR